MNKLNKIDILKEIQKELDDRKAQKIFFSDDFLTVDYDRTNGWLHADWKGYQTEYSVKEGCEQILKALIEIKGSKVLNDNTNVVGIWTPAASWVGHNWFPRMVAAGLRQFAWIYSPSVLSQVSTKEALKFVPNPEVVQTFFDAESASNWLKSSK